MMTSRRIYLVLSIYFFISFAYDMEHTRSMYTWIKLGSSILFFYGFHMIGVELSKEYDKEEMKEEE